jgi:hypothetical protein
LYKIPDFSTLRPGANAFREEPCLVTPLTPPGSRYKLGDAYFGGHVYDPSLDPSFYLHFKDISGGFTLVTLRVDPSLTGSHDPGSPITEVTQVFFPERYDYVETGGGVVIATGLPWVRIIRVSDSKPDDRERTLNLHLPPNFHNTGKASLYFDLVSGRVLFALKAEYLRGLRVSVVKIV